MSATETAQLQPAALGSGTFQSLYEQYSRYVYYLALRTLSDPALAEDATHDVFLKAYRHLNEFRGEATIRTWLYRITINHCHNIQRTWARRNIISTGDAQTLSTLAVTTENPLRILEVKELGQRIQDTLDTLPDEYRLLLLLAADEDLSYREIASLTDQSQDAVRGKLHRARKAFAEAFQTKRGNNS